MSGCDCFLSVIYTMRYIKINKVQKGTEATRFRSDKDIDSKSAIKNFMYLSGFIVQ